ncbi:ead/Ea22-like family protein [Enterobacter hormaechei]|uniref:ead/Ea22-like family protein n=1 Tax=Enterobacter hormaechei TaxID=158836 RepID=UPI000735B8FE|nr:ead/Ea22-like family protein [Enterobacter hormaechei]KTH39043.1 hypothetical protein ASV25_11105 [Enterobacter hormaechei subsp. xiangfangensis]
MSNIDKQALIAKIKKQTESFDTVVLKEDEANALLDELEAKDKRLNEILTPNMLLPVIDEMDVDNLRHVIKTASENYSLLHAKWVAAEKRIAELEAREVTLPQVELVGYGDWPMFDANLVTEALRTAGISIATAGKGE